jgi:hypothetical protein
VPLITRQGKGSKLTIPEMDGNLIYLESLSQAFNITYSELYNKVVNGELVAGSWYRLTDYKSVNFLNGWETANSNPTPTDPNFNPQEIYEGETEVLILQATSPYEISEIGYSETFQGDIVQYEPFTNKIGVTIPNGIYNRTTLPDSSIVSGFDLQWDGTNVYFNMPTGYPALFGHYFYLYAEFQNSFAKGPISSEFPNLSLSGDVTGLSGTYNLLIPVTLTGIGSGLVLDVTVKSGAISVDSINNYGDDYAIGDILLISGSVIGGTNGVNDITITVLAVNTLITDYYQDGEFEPLTPNISICQYPYTSDDTDFAYHKAMSRIRVEEDGFKIVLIDLDENDYNSYISDTLYVETIYKIGNAYGWISRRIDTFRNIDVPFDFRGRKYRRFEVDLSTLTSYLGVNYWGQGDNYLGQGTTGNYKDFKCFGNDGYEVYDIKWDGMDRPDITGNRGYNDNNIFLGKFYACEIGNLFYQNTISDNFFNNKIGLKFSDNAIGAYFNNNTITDDFTSNRISNFFQYNTIFTYFVENRISNNFQNNTINYYFRNNRINYAFEFNIIRDNFTDNAIDPNFSYNLIDNEFRYNTISNNFSINKIAINFQFNLIGGGFFNNRINSDFCQNQININFRRNQIEYSPSNTIFSTATHVYGDYNCTIFKNSAGSLRLSYIDGTDTVQYAAVNG